MNQLERKEYYEEDEIDIYELVDIIIKRKILVLGIFIICSLLGLGCLLYTSNSSTIPYNKHHSQHRTGNTEYFL